MAERALPVAAWLADETGAPIHLLQVVAHPADAPDAIHGLGDLARRCAAPTWEVVVGDDPGAAIAAAVGADRPGLVCMATHGRDRSAAVLGSVAGAAIDRATGPVVLVGPEARPTSADDAPVVTAVEETSNDDVRVLELAAAWVERLDRPLVVTSQQTPWRSPLQSLSPHRDDSRASRAEGPDSIG